MVQLTSETHAALGQHARETFPEECCGAVVRVDGREEVRRITNIQNAMHAKDPHTYPRDATIAYLMEPKELPGRAQSGRCRGRADGISTILTPTTTPIFPLKIKPRPCSVMNRPTRMSRYLVISIYEREVRTIKAFGWDDTQQGFC